MNDLRTLIDVSAGTRLPQYEPEIFSDTELTDYYLRKLCEQYKWFGHAISVQLWAYYYAVWVMKSRWPEAEHIIATGAPWCVWYNHEFGTNLTPPRNKIMAILVKPLCMN